jgi:hypothetical protein
MFVYFEYWLWICVYNLHQHIKNDTDSTDVVENDFISHILTGLLEHKHHEPPLVPNNSTYAPGSC